MNERLLFRIKEILVDCARRNTVIEYGKLSKELGGFVSPIKLNQPLGEISYRCIKEGYPPLSVLVVNHDTQRPGEGFFTWVAAKMGFENLPGSEWEDFFQKQLKEVFTYDQWDMFLANYSSKQNNISSTVPKSNKEKDTHTWIFQGNPAQFRVNDYIRDFTDIMWSLNQEHYQNVISIGDSVYIWRSEAGSKGTGGIIARGIVTGRPVLHKDEGLYWNNSGSQTEKLRVPITIENHLLDEQFIKRIELLEHNMLKNLLILKMSNQTNYLLSQEHSTVLAELWNERVAERKKGLVRIMKQDLLAEKAQNASFYKDGEVKQYYGNRYERKTKNRLRAIEIHGTSCLVCGFDFEKVYGEHGKNFIEVHHIKPLSTLDEAVEINPEHDLVPVCSNCHRMIHRKRDHILSVEELRNLILQRAEED